MYNKLQYQGQNRKKGNRQNDHDLAQVELMKIMDCHEPCNNDLNVYILISFFTDLLSSSASSIDSVSLVLWVSGKKNDNTPEDTAKAPNITNGKATPYCVSINTPLK